MEFKVSRPEKSIKYMKSIASFANGKGGRIVFGIDDKNIMIVEISSGKQKPYYIKEDGITNGVYVRVSGTTRKADRSMTQELNYESEGRSYDTVICKDMSISDEEIEKICIEMKQVALSNCKDDMQRKIVKEVTKNVLLN